LNPQNELNRVYDFFEVERFEHDFDNVQQSTHEEDRIHGIFGDHKIRQQVRPLKSQAIEILGVELCESIKNTYPWFYEYFEYL
jgi:hypothetical protein